MTDDTQDLTEDRDASLDDRLVTTASTSYKVLGEFAATNGAGVLGANTADSGTPIGVEGSVPNATGGYGLATADDARIEGILDTNENDFIVDAGTTTTGDARNVVMGHASNDVSSDVDGAAIGGGGRDDGSTTVLPNLVSDDYGTVGGGTDNLAGSGDGTGGFATVGGGESNEANGNHATVAGGENNRAGALHSTVGGGESNVADTKVGTIVAGGVDNQAIDRWSTVGGGQSNIADGDNATVSGGDNNIAQNQNATVGGGRDNRANRGQATVAGGSNNVASEVNATVGGGFDNTASGRMATVPGGRENEATGRVSVATGRQASAHHDGSVVFGDSSTTPITSSFADVALFQQRVDIGDGDDSGTRLMVEGDASTDDYVLRVREDGNTKLGVHDNGGTSIGTSSSPPEDGVRISGTRSVDELGAGAYLDYDQSIPDSLGLTKVDFDRTKFGTAGSFVDGSFVADRAGRYHVTVCVNWDFDFGWGGGEQCDMEVTKNGARIMRGAWMAAGNRGACMNLNRTVALAENDELWVEVSQQSGESQMLVGNETHSWFEVIHLG
jgi:hypothetical protein